MGLPVILISYDASRHIMLGEDDLAALQAAGGSSRWIAERARGWLAYWKAEIAQAKFYLFDLAAAAYVLHPASFSCARVAARVIRRPWPWSRG